MKIHGVFCVSLLAFVAIACTVRTSQGAPAVTRDRLHELVVGNGGEGRRRQQGRQHTPLRPLKRNQVFRGRQRPDDLHPSLQLLMDQLLGEWNNRKQVERENTTEPAIPLQQQHPLFHATIVRVSTRLFRRQQVALYFQNDLHTPNRVQKTPHFMVLKQVDNDVRMHTYAFRNPQNVIDKWHKTRVFKDLTMDDLIDLGPNCTQQWKPQQDGGFHAKTTKGTCIAQMGDLKVILDIGTQVTPSWLALKFNVLKVDRTPIMFWPQPFNFTREDVPVGMDNTEARTAVNKLLDQILGEWSNSKQIDEERKAVPVIPLQERHPLFHATIVHASTRMYVQPEVSVYFQNDMYIEHGLQQVPHLMVLKPLGNSILMHTYAFRDPAMVLDQWHDQRVFNNLNPDDLLDLGEACEQQWDPLPDGGFDSESTVGTCMGQINNLMVILDIGTKVSAGSLSLKYNIRKANGAPLLVWPKPFQLDKDPNPRPGDKNVSVEQLLEQIVGRWNNRYQVDQEAKASPPLTPQQRHPLFRATIVRVTTRLFQDPEVPVYFENDMYIPQGLQKTPHLMVLRPQDGGVRMRTYAFANPADVLNKWKHPETFLNLTMADLIDLGPACEQQWQPQEYGGFFAPSTMGTCTGQMNDITITMDLGTQVSSGWMTLKYNIYMPDGYPFMFWPEPFNFTRIPDLAYDDVLEVLMRGGDVHYSLDLTSCVVDPDGAPAVLPDTGSNMGWASGKLDHFQHFTDGASQYIHYSHVEMAKWHIATDIFYYQNEAIIVKIQQPIESDQPPVILHCDSLLDSQFGESVFNVHMSTRGKRLTDYRDLSKASTRERHIQLILDRPDQGCQSNQVIPPHSYGTQLQTFFTDEMDTTLHMTSSWVSHDINVCGGRTDTALLNSINARVTTGGKSVVLRHRLLNLVTMEECGSIEMTCPINQDTVAPGARVYSQFRK